MKIWTMIEDSLVEALKERLSSNVWGRKGWCGSVGGKGGVGGVPKVDLQPSLGEASGRLYLRRGEFSCGAVLIVYLCI